MRLPVLRIAALMASFVAPGAAQAGTLQDVVARDELNCGVSIGLKGFSYQHPEGHWSGLDVDVCRAVAAAVLGDPDKVAYTPLTPKERFTTLQSGDVDLLSRNTTWTLLRDAALELNFAGVTFYDGQGFMVREDLGLTSALELDGATICVPIGTTTELNLHDYFKAHRMELRALRKENTPDVAEAYERGDCDAMTSDRSGLASFRSQFEDPGAHILLPEVISKEPLGPVVRHGDDQWFDIVKWTIYLLLQGEESGVTSENVDEMRASDDPTVQRMLGVSGDLGRQLGLPDDWGYQVLKQIGNYGEIYDRSVGPQTPVNLPRGLNALWIDGGLMYPMPIR